MNDTKIAELSVLCKDMGFEAPEAFIGNWMLKNKITNEHLDSVISFMTNSTNYKHERMVDNLIKKSRLPQVAPKLFSNFQARDLPESAQTTIKMLESLSFIEANRNIILIGTTGMGKTHLAQAIGNQCVRSGRSALFLTASELKGRIQRALRSDHVSAFINNIAKNTCLIIDELGQTERYNKEETHLLFSIVERIYNKPGSVLVVTSNKESPEWEENFGDPVTFECILDRLYDTALAVSFSGTSYRGRMRTDESWNFDNPLNMNLT